jgi:hypothetical protein
VSRVEQEEFNKVSILRISNKEEIVKLLKEAGAKSAKDFSKS